MNIHEYQAKQLLAQYGVAVPSGDVYRFQARNCRKTLPSEKRYCDQNQSRPAALVKALSKAVSGNSVKLYQPPIAFAKKTKGYARQVLVTSKPVPKVSSMAIACRRCACIKKGYYLADIWIAWTSP